MFSQSGPQEALNRTQLTSETPAQTRTAPSTTETTESNRFANRFLRIHATAPVVLTGASRAGIISILGLPLHQRHARVDYVQDECEYEAYDHVGDDEHQGHRNAGARLVRHDDADGEQFAVR